MIFRLALIKRVSLVHDASLRRLAIIQPSLGYEKEYPRTLILMRRQQYIMLLARRNMTLLLGSWSVKLRSSLLYLTTRVYTPRSGSDREWERRRLSAHQGAASIPSPHRRVILAYRGVFIFFETTDHPGQRATQHPNSATDYKLNDRHLRTSRQVLRQVFRKAVQASKYSK